MLPVELSYELDCLAKSEFGGSLNGSWTGHPHRDPRSGELHGMSYYHGWNHVSYQVIEQQGRSAAPSTCRSTAARWCTTARSPSGTRSSSTGRVAYSDELAQGGL